jgi:hypothetical protein
MAGFPPQQAAGSVETGIIGIPPFLPCRCIARIRLPAVYRRPPCWKKPERRVAMISAFSAPPASAGRMPLPDHPRHAALMGQAKALEASFLAEMLGHIGPSSHDGSFGGGAGEGQFASFLREEQARLIVAGGGLGLAERLFTALARRAGELE